jgi:arylsulfatase A-like enzyme
VYNPASKIPTPNLDRLAAEGKLFTHAHAPAAVCTPTRYSLLTGRYPWRSQMKKGVLWVWDPPLLEPEQPTIGTMLQSAGYHTAIIGKWHLGWHWPTVDGVPPTLSNQGRNVDYRGRLRGGPTERGFDYYYGDDVPGFPPHALIENDSFPQVPSVWYDRRPFLAGAATPGWQYEALLPAVTDKACEYLRERVLRHPDKPFFLFFSLPSPHTPIAPGPDFQGRSGAGPYGDYVMETDYQTGRILDLLDSLGVAGETLVVFTSDNGPTTEDGEGYHGEFGAMERKYGHRGSAHLRGVKADTYEGGHRIPYLVRYPGTVPAGTRSDALLSQTDMLATLAAICGGQVPAGSGEDSYDMSPVLLDADGGTAAVRRYLVTQSGKGALSIRSRDWKLILSSGSHGHWTQPTGMLPEWREGRLENVQLFRLSADSSEAHDLSATEPNKVSELARELARQVQSGGTARPPGGKPDTMSLWEEVEWIRGLPDRLPE